MPVEYPNISYTNEANEVLKIYQVRGRHRDPDGVFNPYL